MKILSVYSVGLRNVAIGMAMILVLSSCEQDELLYSGEDYPDAETGLNPVETKDGTITWFGPEIFKVRKKGPVTYKRSLAKGNFDDYKDFILVVQNGSGGNTKVTKLEILIDGSKIVTFADFRRNTNIITKKLDDLKASSELVVRLYGSKGRFINLRIECFPKEAGLADIEGNTYKTVTIGDQVWMAENLRTTRFTDGTPITNVSVALDWANAVNLNQEAAYCWYNNDISNKQLYGAFYNLHAVAMGFNNDLPRHLCPAGWHVPTSQEWQKLILTLDPSAIEGANPMSETAGGKLKEAGLLHWESPNAGATNESGFTALPGGFRDEDGSFEGIRQNAFFWGDNGYSARHLGYDHTLVMFKETSNAFGYSVRCVKD